ncbi:MAG: sulfatase [Candidatus Hydrogenedentes bacterium]|nr:sulfatase [Candidatus Hydrogenedentota bacterium]
MQRQLPNIVFVVVDTLRADKLDAQRNGVPIMPQLSEFSRSACRFDACMTQEVWTLPSVTSLFSSLYPEVHGIRYSTDPNAIWRSDRDKPTRNRVSSRIPLATAVLKKAGYSMLAVQTNSHLRTGMGLDRDFDEYKYMWAALGETVTTEAIQLAGSAKPPYFLYCHYFDPHSVYVEHPDFFHKYGTPPTIDDQDRRLISNFVDYYIDHFYSHLRLSKDRKYAEISPAGREHVRYLYDVECAYVDFHVAQLIQVLDHISGGENIVVVTSDHGEELWDHGALGHGKTAYSELVNVPLLLRMPGLGPTRSKDPIQLIDVMPTLLDYLHIESPSEWQGISALPRLTDVGRSSNGLPAFTSVGGTQAFTGLNTLCVVTDYAKLVIDNSSGVEQLFDIIADPGERHNLAQSRTDLRDKLRSLVLAHSRENEKHSNFGMELETAPADPEMVQELRALGYVGTSPAKP